MKRLLVHLLPLAALLVLQASCASVGLSPSSHPQPAARAALRPELRIFYDALEAEGDWVLIEPLGWLFRPDVNTVAWRPYENGFWTWNDWYGWVWVSEEPFGWATYHYGRWIFDAYQGWVWIPGADWGPAWVAWARNGDYLGWAPLPTAGEEEPGSGYPQGTPAVNGWSFVSAGQLAGPDLSSRLVNAEQTRGLLAEAKPIVRMAEREGRAINLGPPVELVEKAAGAAVPRTDVRDALPVDAAKAAKPRPSARPAGEGGAVPASEMVRRAGQEAARQAERLSAAKAPPPAVLELPRIRPFGKRAAGRGEAAKAPAAASDTLLADTSRAVVR